MRWEVAWIEVLRAYTVNKHRNKGGLGDGESRKMDSRWILNLCRRVIRVVRLCSVCGVSEGGREEQRERLSWTHRRLKL